MCSLSHHQMKNRPNQTSLMIPNSQVIDLWKVPENTKDEILVCVHVVHFTVDIFHDTDESSHHNQMTLELLQF